MNSGVYFENLYQGEPAYVGSPGRAGACRGTSVRPSPN